MIQLKKLGEKQKQAWVHMTCVNWIKEIYFEVLTDSGCLTQESEDSKVYDFQSGSSGVIVGTLQPWHFSKHCEVCEN